MALQPPKSATDAAGDVFLSGSYLEIGISYAGNFGTNKNQTPPGYAQPDANGVGLVDNKAGFGVDPNIPSIDFFTPGSPFEAFAVGYTIGGVNHSGYNYANGSHVDVTPVSLTNTSSGSTLSAEWIGVLDGKVRITIDYSFGATDIFYKSTVTLTNISGAALDDVRYVREVDPDNTEDVDGITGFSTVNTIVAQQPTDGASEVTATSAPSGNYHTATGSTASLVYYSTDASSRVAKGLSSGSVNAFDSAFWTGQPAGSTTGLNDTRVSIGFDSGALAAGASTSFTYYTGLTSDIAATIAAIQAAAAAPILAPASDSGVKGDNVTSVTTPVITGSGTAGDTITLLDGPTPVGTATVGADGKWSITTAALADGVHTLTATETDPTGPTSPASPALQVTIDTVPPTSPGNLVLAPASDSGVAGDGITNIKTPVITGTGAVGDTITLVDGSAVVGTATVGVDGAWSVTTNHLADGTHTLTAKQSDAAGNASRHRALWH